MKSLAEQLVECGLASERSIQERKCTDMLVADAVKSRHNTLGRGVPMSLEQCATVTEFRAVAKYALLRDTRSMEDVISFAHRFKETKGGGRIIWEMYQVQKGLRDIDPAKREQFLDRAFRKSARKFNIDF